MRRVLSLTLLLAVFAGCSEDSASVQFVGPFCDGDRDCANDQTCHRGQCLGRAPAAVSRVDIEITPPASSALSRVQLLDVSLDTSVETVLDVPRPTMFGAIQVLDGTGSAISARVSFRGRDRIATREVDSQLLLDRDRSTGLSLLPGLYDVRVLPTDADVLPGVEIRGLEVRSEAFVPRRDLAVPSRYRVVRGEVARRTTSSLKIPGVTVRARSIGAGLPSTRSVTGLDGRYEILLPDTPDASFVLTAEPPAADGLAWSFTQTITTLGETTRELSIPLEETTDTVRGLLRLRVLGRGDAGPEPVAGARVVLSATTGLDYRALTLEGTTDAQGYLGVTDGPRDLEALAARYRVTVEPPLASAWQVSEGRLDLSQISANLVLDKQIELMRKVEVRGAVASNLGQAVADARLSFEPADGRPRVASTTTDASGGYVVRLEAGSYVVTVTPTPNSKVSEALPVGFTTLEVPATVATIDAAPITLGAGAILRARLRDPSGAPVARAEVELFVRVDGRPLSLGRVVCDEVGAFAMIVPTN